MSREGITWLSRRMVERLWADPSMRMLKDRELVRQAIAQVVGEEIRQHEERQSEVQRRMETLDGAPPLGSEEWKSTFDRMLEEEYNRYVFENI